MQYWIFVAKKTFLTPIMSNLTLFTSSHNAQVLPSFYNEKLISIYLDTSFKNTVALWVAAKLNPQISPRRVLDILYPIFCFQQAFWLNIRHSMSPLKNIYIFRRIFLRQKLKNRAKIEKSVKIKNWQMNFFGFFFSFFG